MKELYIVPRDTRCKPYTAEVTSIGHKYITVDRRVRFDKNTFPYESVPDNKGWNPQLIAYNSEEQCKRLRLLEADLSMLRRQAISLISNCDDKIVLSTIVYNLKNN